MNDSKWTWRSVSLISIAATVLLIVGFIYAVNDIINPAGDTLQTSLPQGTATPLTETTGLLKVVALGDSLAKGTGDNTGAGFVKRAVDSLAADGEQTELLGNMGINGQTTLGLQSSLKEEGVQYELRQANVILLSIGGNDLFRGSDILKDGSNSSTTSNSMAVDKDLTPEALLTALPEAAKRLGLILDSIAKINPQAQIYYLGLYNPFGDIPDLLVPGNQAVAAWNNAAMDIINKHSNMTLVPTFDLFNRHLDKYLSSDHFHPNGDGYQRMGERIVQAVR
ncbi:lysophospholipase [Paenibacillus sp. 19GGS1-52]|uniref:GDSL-type esterase/lipase family protein n=1 Tax=Paenibacillus sp. 19GGS1-52 TaxID=2758563 RepID=UPI001EFB550F|nr:GDSL-type esterase/lipase family protein [Paenibacillus sp. 19GGS1-52]ULO09394.1 lysophospholipase [Paenibacillus sp. 19GGS1-52]